VAGGGVSDLVNVHGNLTLAGMLNVSNAGGFGSGVYRLFNYTGSLTNDGLSLRTLPSGFSPADFLVQTTQPGEVNLVVSSGGFATQFWDGPNTVADGVIHGGSGTWNTTTTNWTNASATANAPWQNGFAVFEGTAGTVSLGNNIHISGMQFITNGYTIVAPGTLTLIGAPGTTIRVDQGVSATISAPIADGTSPSAITKADLGTLILSGANTSLVNAGILVAAANSALGSALVTVNDPSLLRIDPGVTVTNFIQLNNGGSLDNAGTVQVTAVTGGPAAAVTTVGGATITNEGGAKISGIGLIAIQSLNGPATITNSGSISGTQGILLRGGGTITNNAAGAISGLTGPAIATAAPASTAGPPPLPGPVTVVNSGTITGATSGISLGGGGSVTNTITGQVTGTGGTAVSIGGSQAKLSNAGQIIGDVQLSASSNTAQLFTGGKISGSLTLNPVGTNQVILDGSGTQLLSQSVVGTISNAGVLTKQGTGEWILDKSLSPPVSTLINSGILQVNSGQPDRYGRARR
jgi:fibronectin-binding autotransporter adhesin